jgi:YHS domain-containing protein
MERMRPCAVSEKEHDAMREMDQPEVRPNFDPMGPDPHTASQRQEGTSSGQFAVDPVCGKEIDPRTARFTANYLGGGQPWDTFYFCSDECKQLFERDPEHYIRQL